jgi:hypothetical protein
MSAPLLSLEQVKAILGIEGSESDEKLTPALAVVTEYFENHCKRGLAYESEVVEEFRVTTRLALFRFPVDEVIELLVDGVPFSGVTVNDLTRGFIRIGYNAAQVARVTYAGGYVDDAVPADLADAYARCVADYAGVTHSAGGGSGAGGGGAPLKSLGLGSGALTVAFDTGAAAQQTYDTSGVPPVLAPYLFVLEHYRVKDYV